MKAAGLGKVVSLVMWAIVARGCSAFLVPGSGLLLPRRFETSAETSTCLGCLLARGLGKWGVIDNLIGSSQSSGDSDGAEGRGELGIPRLSTMAPGVWDLLPASAVARWIVMCGEKRAPPPLLERLAYSGVG